MIRIEERPAKKLPGITNLFVSFDYDIKILEVMRALPNRFYNKDTKEWEVPLNKIEYLVNNIDQDFEIIELVEEDNQLQTIPADYLFKTEPYPHQVEGVQYGLNYDSWILGDEQGLGKTKQIIDLACVLKQQGKIKHCLIICGVNNLKSNWFNEVKTHSNEKAYILGTRYRQNGKKIIGSLQDRIYDIMHIPEDTLFIITNIETFRDDDFRDALKSLNIIEMAVIDEAHKVKNPTSEQGKNILKLTNFKYKVAMTGTLIMNSPLDAYTSLKWLGIEKSNFSTFKSFYCNFGGFGGHQVMGYKNLNVLREMISKHMLRRTKEEVLGLPPKVHQIEYIEMSAKQQKIYDDIKRCIMTDIDRILATKNPLVELLRLRQATGATSIVSSTINESAKLDRLEDFIEELASEGKKAIVFSNWEQMTILTKERLKKYNPAYVAGGEIKDLEIDREKQKFQNDPNCKVIIGTTSKLGTGHTLTAASTVIFLDDPWNRANKEQAEDRAHRIGTTGTVNIVTFVCRGTIDEKIEELITKKGAMADLLVDGKMTRQNYQELLSFLLAD